MVAISARRQLDLFLQTLTRAVAIGVLIIVALVVGPLFERKYFPVVTEVKVYQVPATADNKTALVVIGNKERDECELVSIKGLSGDLIHPVKSKITFPYETEESQEEKLKQSRPAGRQSFGVWEFEPKGDYVRVIVQHRCYTPWLLTTTMFEWDINKEQTVPLEKALAAIIRQNSYSN